MTPEEPLLSSARRRTQVLAVMMPCLIVVVSATSALNIALPEVAAETGATQTEMQWITDAYALVFAVLLLPAGALGDRYGRRGMLLTGLAVFGAACGALAKRPAAQRPSRWIARGRSPARARARRRQAPRSPSTGLTTSKAVLPSIS